MTDLQFFHCSLLVCREKCTNTAVLFLALPRIPQDPHQSERYLEQLNLLTRDLPPVLLVHGVHPVVTTSI